VSLFLFNAVIISTNRDKNFSLPVQYLALINFLFQFYDGFSTQSERFLTLALQRDLETIRLSRDNIMTFRLNVNRRYITYTGYTMRYSAIGKFCVAQAMTSNDKLLCVCMFL